MEGGPHRSPCLWSIQHLQGLLHPDIQTLVKHVWPHRSHPSELPSLGGGSLPHLKGTTGAAGAHGRLQVRWTLQSFSCPAITIVVVSLEAIAAASQPG